MIQSPEIPDGGAPKKNNSRANREFELGLLTAVLSQRGAELDRREAELNALAQELEMLQALMSQTAPTGHHMQEAAAVQGGPIQGAPPLWMQTQ